jgi:hypothetical protein
MNIDDVMCDRCVPCYCPSRLAPGSNSRSRQIEKWKHVEMLHDMKGFLTIDLVSTIPWGTIVLTNGALGLVQLFKAAKVVRIIRVLKLVRILRLVKVCPASECISCT